MALQGKIIKVDGGRLAIECLSTDYSKPLQYRHVWAFDAYRFSGMSYCREDDAIGKPASVTDGRVSCYLGNGNYLKATLPQGGSTKAIILEVTDLPAPKCRCETRWHNGRWEKYNARKGWIVA